MFVIQPSEPSHHDGQFVSGLHHDVQIDDRFGSHPRHRRASHRLYRNCDVADRRPNPISEQTEAIAVPPRDFPGDHPGVGLSGRLGTRAYETEYATEIGRSRSLNGNLEPVCWSENRRTGKTHRRNVTWSFRI